MTCVAGTRLTLYEPLYQDRSARAFELAMEACRMRLIEIYKRKEGIRTLYSDKEPALKSKTMQAYFTKHKITIRFTQMKRQKSFLAENAIRYLRVQLHRLQINEAHATHFNPFEHLERLERQHNNVPLVIKNKTLLFTPAGITARNYNAFIETVRKKDPTSYYNLFLLPDEGYVSFRFRLDQPVYLKQHYVSSQAIEKRSTKQVVLQPVFRVASRYTVYSARKQLVPYYRIVPELLPDDAVAVNDETTAADALRARVPADWQMRGLLVPEEALTAY